MAMKFSTKAAAVALLSIAGMASAQDNKRSIKIGNVDEVIARDGNVKRQNDNGFVGGGDTCDEAPIYSLMNGRLSSGGVQVGVDPEVAAIEFTSATGSIRTAWSIRNGVLTWTNTQFSGGRAGFCVDIDNTLWITFVATDDPDYPADCEAIEITAYDSNRCVNGVIVDEDDQNNNNDEGNWPSGVPREDDLHLIGRPTPSGEACITTTLSWIPGEPTFFRDEL